MKNLFISFILFSITFGNIINVPNEAWSIQNGIDVANVGDTVLVSPGTYFENVNVNKNITLASHFILSNDTAFTSTTIIDGFNSGPCMNIESSANVLGFTLTNGNGGEGYTPGASCNDVPGGGIRILQIWGAGSWCINVSDMRIIDNFSGLGGGIGIAICQSSSCLNFTNVLVESNSTGNGPNMNGNGGGIWMKGGSPVFENCTIKDNFSPNEGSANKIDGVYNYGSNATFNNCKFINNELRSNSTGTFNKSLFKNSDIYIQESGTQHEINQSTFQNSTIGLSGSCSGQESTIISSSILSGLWAATLTNGNVPCDPVHVIRYSAIPGGYIGAGNIDADPLFVNAENGNYNLSWLSYPTLDDTKSPCIDTGDPNPDFNDPDGSRADMGAFFFNQAIPIVEFSAEPLSGNSPMEVQFNNLSTTGLYGSGLSSYFWDFGDGSTSNDQNPNHVYINGINDVSLTVFDESGYSSTLIKNSYIVVNSTQVLELDIGGDEDLMHLVDHNPYISFNFYNGDGGFQTHYQAQISSSENFSEIDMWDTGILTGNANLIEYGGNALLDGMTYYLRVRLKSQELWSEWSQLTFKMNSKPTAPIVLSPVNAQNPELPIILSVLNSSDAESDPITYSFTLLNSDSDILESITSVSQGIDTTTWQVTVSFDEDIQYLWFASANDGYEESIFSEFGSFLFNTENDAPAEFSLLSPEDGEQINEPFPLFDWSPAIDPDPLDIVSYTLFLDTPAPGVLIIDLDTLTYYEALEPLIDNSTYHWKVAATDINGATTENVGGYHSFRVNTENDLPSNFALLAPESTSMVVDLKPTLIWEVPTDADDRNRSIESYRVYLGINLANVIPDTVINNRYTPEVDLLEDTIYRWKVIAVDNDGGIKESSTWSFWTNSDNSIPTEVTLLTPSDGEETNLFPTFSWTESNDVDLYDEITYTISYGSDVSMLSSVDVGSDLIYSLENDLQDNTTYYWQVVAMDLSGATFVTPMQSFRVNSVNDNPDIFSLISPDSSGVINALHTLLVWTPTVDLDGDNIIFEVYVDNEMIDFTDNNYLMISDLVEDRTYTWHVKAYDSNQGMSETLPWSFTTNSENSPPEEFSLVEPLDNAVLNIFNPPFCWEETTDLDLGDNITYSIALGEDLDSMSVIYVGPYMESCFYETMGMFEDNTTYYWSIVASDDAGAVSASNIQSFTINTQNDSPGLATLIAPLQGSIQTEIRPSFYWSEANDPDPFDHVTYSLEWWPVNEIDIMFIEDVDTNTFTPEFDLSDNAKFGWRVTAKDIEGLSSMTDSLYFFTDVFPEPPLAFNTIYPENNAEGLETSIDFVWNATIDPDPLDVVTYQLVYGTDWQDSSTYVFSDITTDTSISVLFDDNIQFYWIVIARDADGFIVGSNNNTPNMVTIGALSVDENTTPRVFALHQNYPNPFNPTTNISYDLPEQSEVTLSIFDLVGRKLRTLINGEQTAGFKNIQWNAMNDNDQPVPAGMYIYTIQAGEFRQTRKMVLLK